MELLLATALLWGKEGLLIPSRVLGGRLGWSWLSVHLPSVTTRCLPRVVADSAQGAAAPKIQVEKCKHWSEAVVELTLTFPSGREKDCKVPPFKLMVSYSCCEKLWMTAWNAWWQGTKCCVCSGLCHCRDLSQQLCSSSLWAKSSVPFSQHCPGFVGHSCVEPWPRLVTVVNLCFGFIQLTVDVCNWANCLSFPLSSG